MSLFDCGAPVSSFSLCCHIFMVISAHFGNAFSLQENLSQIVFIRVQYRTEQQQTVGLKDCRPKRDMNMV